MATPGWADAIGSARFTRAGLTKTSGWSVLAVDAFFVAAGPPGSITGTLAASESAKDTFAATGGVLVAGLLAATESGPDVFAVSGTVGSAAVTGTLAGTESGADTFTASGTSGAVVTAGQVLIPIIARRRRGR